MQEHNICTAINPVIELHHGAEKYWYLIQENDTDIPIISGVVEMSLPLCRSYGSVTVRSCASKNSTVRILSWSLLRLYQMYKMFKTINRTHKTYIYIYICVCVCVCVCVCISARVINFCLHCLFTLTL